MFAGETVKGPEPPDQVNRMDSDDRPIREELGQDAAGEAVFGIVEGRHEDGRVRDVEVRITGRQTLAIETYRRGHR